MITVQTNIDIVSTALLKKLEVLRDPKPLLRPVAIDVLNLMTERIHEQGKAADDSQIGTYSVGYLRFRSTNGRGSDSKVIASFTRQLSSALNVTATDNGWGIGVLVTGRNAIDNFLNKTNKAKGKGFTLKPGVVKDKQGAKRVMTNNDLIPFLEKKYKKKIWSPSQSEKDYAIGNLQKRVNEILNS